jgi:hypothetical protein
VDWAGAPKATPWSFTFEDHAGVVFNQDGKGCPVWVNGVFDYTRAHEEKRWAGVDLETPEWVTVGYRVIGGAHGEEVLVLGSADLTEVSLGRRMHGYDSVEPFSSQIPDYAKLRAAKVPRWHILFNCRMQTFVQVTGKDYPAAVQQMFGKAGRSG